jgi:hypothetical protein
MVSIYRPRGGISLNGKEYVLDAKDNVMTFADVPAAKKYLKRMGVSEQDIEDQMIDFEKEV